MITHIVFIRLKGCNPKEKSEKLNHLDKLLQELEVKIDVIDSLETGLNFNTRPSAYDLVLIVKLQSKEDIDIYRTHPEHVKVLEYMKTLNLETGVVDY